MLPSFLFFKNAATPQMALPAYLRTDSAGDAQQKVAMLPLEGSEPGHAQHTATVTELESKNAALMSTTSYTDLSRVMRRRIHKVHVQAFGPRLQELPILSPELCFPRLASLTFWADMDSTALPLQWDVPVLRVLRFRPTQPCLYAHAYSFCQKYGVGLVELDFGRHEITKKAGQRVTRIKRRQHRALRRGRRKQWRI
ncbi:hypothetical protein PHLGIDRAFT_427017 [Phlebiopsis gigantea 11061_1 CR5-6]|uniref:Uncharacterized protein n=1 Tax=Phlebiopsis gigantea (strain 11061_1 CR5-6) TaxID=745531 RepID=A0A0C3S898_PHLG1|nr:hypothetical protein PHLGIDRAFT_427017 [Phlebiopsis gigantea 11061_1 CR5-6]